MSVTSKRAFSLPEKSSSAKQRAARLYRALETAHPNATCALDYRTPHELLVATILSAQSTDVGVNKATPRLFAAFPTAADYASASPEDIQPWINSIGLYRNKAKAIHAAMQRIVDHYDGEVPQTMVDLLSLRGVAPCTKTFILRRMFCMM